MRFSAHRGDAARIALIAVAVSFGCTLAFDGLQHLLLAVLVHIVAWGMLYMLLSWLLQRFIVKKITPIYRTIYGMGVVRKSMRKFADDPIALVNLDVANWAETRIKEISRLSAAEVYRREFLDNVSHELKTPIFALQGMILTLLDGGLEDPNINRKYLERCERNVERLIKLLEDMGVINGLEKGYLQLHKTVFDLRQLVEEAIETLATTAEQQQITLRISSSPGYSAMVRADRHRIMQVVVNLISNSIRYGRRGGETVVVISDIPYKVLLEVKDNGIGIPAGHLPHIFDRFYRVDKHRSREHGGSGLGLPIVKHILEAHEQGIRVESLPDKGTIFGFTLEKPNIIL